MEMILIHRPRVNHHLFAPRYFSQELPIPLAYSLTQNLIAMLCRPHRLVFAIADRVAASIGGFYRYSLISSTSPSPKGRRFPGPYQGL